MKFNPLTKMSIFICIGILFLSVSSNPPNGKTGAPEEGFCTDCHIPPNLSIEGDLTISGLPSEIVANQSYTLTITSQLTSGTATRTGFQMVALDGNDVNAGTMMNPTNMATVTSSDGRDYLEHSPAISFNGSNSVSWTVDWIAPSGPDGDQITFYGTSILANGDGDNSGDRMRFFNESYTLNASGTPMDITIVERVDPSCQGANDGFISIEISGGVPPYNILWSNGSNIDVLENLTAGVYSFEVEDSANTVLSDDIVLAEGPPLNFSIDIANPNCFGESTGIVNIFTEPFLGGNFEYAWSDGVVTTASMRDGLSAGTYEITVTSLDADCSDVVIVDLDEPLELEIALNTLMDDDCGTGSGFIQIDAIQGGDNLEYNWSNGSTFPDIFNLTAGIYEVTVSNENGCFLTEAFTIAQSETPLSLNEVQIADPTCGSNGSITVDATGGTPPYQYSWSTGTTGPNVFGLSEGTYSVSITDQNQCILVDQYEIIGSEVNQLTIDVIAIDLSCFGDNSGSIELIIEPIEDFVSANWSNGESGTVISNLPTGTYLVTVTDVNGCEQILANNLAQPTELSVSVEIDELIQCNGGTVTISDIIAQGGTPQYEYYIDNQPIDVNATLGAGTYTLDVLDQFSCSATVDFIIEEPAPITLNVELAAPSCNSETDGAISITAEGGTPGYNYVWSNGVNGQNIENLTEGTYSVTVTDDAGCANVEFIELIAPQPIVVMLTTTDATSDNATDGSASIEISGGTPDLSATPSYTINWSTNDSDFYGISELGPGEYSVEVLDLNNCSTISTFIINASSCDLNADYAAEDVNCNGLNDGMITLFTENANGEVQYDWSNGISGPESSISGLAAGDYNVTITDGDNCQIVLNGISVEEPSTLNVDVSVVQQPDCNGSGAEINPIISGGTPPYEFELPNLTDIAEGNYNLIVNDNNGCEAMGSFTISYEDTTGPNLDVEDYIVYINEFGEAPTFEELGIQDAITDECGFVSETIFDPEIILCGDGTPSEYQITMVDNSSNATTAVFLITVIDTFPPEMFCISDQMVSSCDDFVPTSPIAFDNCDLESIQMISGIGKSESLVVGENLFSFIATDNQGNTTECSYIVTVDVAINYELEVENVSCPGASDGLYIVTPEDPDAIVIYDGGYLSNLDAGVYSFSIIDGSGCMIQDSIEIFETEGLAFVNSIVFDASNTVSEDGALDIDIDGGALPYNFEWYDEDGMLISTEEDPSNLRSGDYTCQVFDANGCNITIELTVGFVTSLGDEFIEDLIVYPNPSTGKFIIDTDNTIKKLRLFELDGKRVLLDSASDQTSFTIQGTTGSYILQITTTNGVTYKKIFKI